MERKLKIWHSADIQIEVRNNAQRYDEFVEMLDKLANSAKGFDIAVLAGDLTEFAIPNEVERKLLQNFISNLAENVKEVVIIKGNHDIVQQQSRNTFVANGTKKNIPDALDILYPSFPKNVLLCTNSLVYMSNVFNLQYVVWNQKHKYELDPKYSYNPLENDKIELSIPAITLFHDCVRNATNFDNKPVRGSNDKPDYPFETNLILAGDIHCPAIIKKDNGQIFTYCSSPIERDFGEGDYYLNGKLIQSGSDKHGYNEIEFDTITNTGEVKFVHLQQYSTFQTLMFDRNFDEETFKEYYNPVQAECTKIKIRIKDDYDRIVNHLETILGIIKLRNKNADISIETGKDLDGTNVGTSAEIDTEALVSMDKIKEIAAEFITKKVNSSRVIGKDDKNRVIREIVQMLNKELEYFEHSSNALNLVPLKLEVSNFMALGDNNSIDFRNGITKLSGSNGTGKSTIFNAIKWLWTDMVYPSQKANYKKENALILFNNKRPDIDTVYGKIVQLVNGDEMTITKTITRYWKKNTTIDDKISENWQEYCEMPTTECIVEYQDKVYENDEALQFLSNIFPSLSDITRTLFATAPSLFNIINTSTNELNDEILYNLGLDFFETLVDRYDSLRSSIMDNLSKPSLTEGEYLAQIEERTKHIEETIKPLIDNISKCITQHESDIKDNTEKKDLLQKMLYNVSEQDIKDNNRKIMQYVESNNDIDETIKDLEDKIAFAKNEYENQKVETELPALTKKVNTLKSELEESIKLQNTLQKELVEITEKGSKRQNQILDEVRDQVLQLKQIISDIEREKLEFESKLKESEYEHQRKINAKDAETKTKKQDLENAIKLLENNTEYLHKTNDSLKERNDHLASDDVCHACGRKHTKESWQFANKEYERNEQKIVFNNEIIEENASKIEAYKTQISELQNNLVFETQKMTKEYESQIAAIKLDIDATTLNIDKYKNELEGLKQNTTQKINADKEILELVTQKSKLNKRIEEIELVIGQNRLQINVSEQDLENIKKIEQTYHSDVAIWQEKIASNTNTKKLQLSLIAELETKIKEIESQLEKNKVMNEEIATIIAAIQKADSEIKQKQAELLNAKVELNSLVQSNTLDNENIAKAIEWRVKDASLRIYKQIIGKNGLSTYIFSMIRPNLNSALNEMLNGLGFVLMFNENNELKMIKINDDKQIKQSVAFSSGMESTFLGLSLLHVLKTKNVTKRINILFIDEVTGALNDGTDLSYEAMNYQEMFKELLHKMKKQFNIVIIDHVIKNLEEDQRLEVVPTSDGAEIVTVF